MLTAPDIQRVVCGAYRENAYLVCPEGQEGAFCIDPGDDLPALQKALRMSGRRLEAILLTHGHFDHMLAAQPLSEETGAPVYISAGDDCMLDDPEAAAYSPEASQLPPPKGLPRKLYGPVVTVCGTVLHVLSTPGHSRGSVCLYDPEGGILFSGDTLFSCGYGRTDLFGGSFDDLVSSLRMLLNTLPEDTEVYPGHGPITAIDMERRRYRL